MHALSVRLLTARLVNRGTWNTFRLLRYHIHHFVRYNTTTKMVNLVMIKTQKWFKVARVRGMPYRYNIDPMNICNLKCPVCPTGIGILGREQGKIHFEDYQRIVDQIAKYAYVLELYNWGEPLLHSRIFDMIRYAHERRISVRMSSNLNYLTPKLAEQLVASGLDRLIVSVDGSTQEVYEKYRRGGNLGKVLDNIRMLVEEKNRQGSRYPFILMRMLVNRYNEQQVADLRQMAVNLGVDAFSTGGFFVDTTNRAQIQEWLPKNEAQSYYDYSAAKMENVWHCAELWEGMTINWDGGISPCCWLHQKKNDFDNAFTKPIEEIWNGDEYVSSRRVFAWGGQKDGPSQTICTRCKGRPLYLKD